MGFNPPLLDNFTQTDGAIDGRVASSGYIWESPMVTTHVAGQIVSNAFQGASAQDRDAGLQGSWGPNVEVAATITALGSAIFIRARIQQSFPMTGGDFYNCRVTIVGGTDNDTLAIVRTIGGVASTQATYSIGDDWAVGDSFGFSLEETGASTRYTGYRKPSGGEWGSVGTGTDSNAGRPVLAGAIGIEIDNSVAAIDDLLGWTTETAGAMWLATV